MDLHIHLNLPVGDILNQLENIMATQAELAQQLTDLVAENDRTRDEIVAKIKSLEDALAAGGTTTPEVDAAVAALKASIGLDDQVA